MGEPVTLWRYDEPHDGIGSHYVEGDHLSTDVEYRALPAAEFDALTARLAVALRECDDLRELLRRCRKYVAPHTTTADNGEQHAVFAALDAALRDGKREGTAPS